MSVKILLMAGGMGTRLWPKSRESIPKQFMSLAPHPSLFQNSYRRCLRLAEEHEVFVVVPPEYKHHVCRQAPEIPRSRIIVEPLRRSTTASLGYALLHLEMLGLEKTDTVVVMPTDTYVDNEDALKKCIHQALDAARTMSSVVTIGVRPTYPATGYGYIYASERVNEAVLRVGRFVEKPTLAAAQDFAQNDSYYWNAGIFVWSAQTIWNLIAEHLPESFRTFNLMRPDMRDANVNALQSKYMQLPDMSFEYSLLEKATSVLMVPASFHWTDLGTWSALIEALPEVSSDSVATFDTDGCLVSTDDRLVALFGVRDVIVVATKDVVFVCHRERECEMKQFVSYLQSSGYGHFL